MKARKYETFENVKKELFNKDKELKKEYEALRPRYELVSKMIAARIKQKMTQEEVAIRMGTTKSSISRFESGEYNPTMDFLIKLTGALGKQLKVNVV